MAKIFLVGILFVFAGDLEAQLLLYGGENSDQFLGCLSCGLVEEESVCNEFGPYGNEMSQASIWNRQSRYGNRNSRVSPWNRIGSSPPIVVDREGNDYGLFTINRSEENSQLTILLRNSYSAGNNDLTRVRDRFCRQF